MSRKGNFKQNWTSSYITSHFFNFLDCPVLRKKKVCYLQNYIYKILVTLRVRTICKLLCATEYYSKRGLLLLMKIEFIGRNRVSSLAYNKINNNNCFKGSGQDLEVFSS